MTTPGRRKGAAGKPARRGSYHHGDLREALVAMAETVLAERGPEGFTLRECARRLGVSNAAPAHHFEDVTALLCEVAARGFERLRDLMRARLAEAGADPETRLKAIGLAYIEAAVARPATFRLMFHSDRCADGSEHLSRVGAEAYGVLVETLEALPRPPGRAAGLTETHLAWSAVHGFATLLVDGRLRGDPRFGPPETWRAHASDMLDALIPGLGGRPGAA